MFFKRYLKNMNRFMFSEEEKTTKNLDRDVIIKR